MDYNCLGLRLLSFQSGGTRGFIPKEFTHIEETFSDATVEVGDSNPAPHTTPQQHPASPTSPTPPSPTSPTSLVHPHYTHLHQENLTATQHTLYTVKQNASYEYTNNTLLSEKDIISAQKADPISSPISHSEIANPMSPSDSHSVKADPMSLPNFHSVKADPMSPPNSNNVQEETGEEAGLAILELYIVSPIQELLYPVFSIVHQAYHTLYNVSPVMGGGKPYFYMPALKMSKYR